MARITAASAPVQAGTSSNGGARPEALVQSYRRVAEVFHDVMSEQSLDALLDRIADTLAELEPYDAPPIYEAGDALALDNAHIRARLERLAQTDSLTGLYNHRYFHERLRSELTRASRSHDSVAVLMFDLDDFKRVNDVYGHGLGDELLREVAAVVSKLVRGSDVLCRIGGEEFGVIMPSCDASDALGLAIRVIAQLRDTEFEPAGH